MKKHIILLGALAISSVAYSQVGINTDQPKATLDVVASPDKPTLIDGFIAPRLTGDELKAKDALYTAEQLGAIVYATTASSDAGTDGAKTINIDAEGYYYFDGTVWVKVGAGAGGKEPWYDAATNAEATENTQNIYQMGRVGIGAINPTVALHIVNDDKGGNDDDVQVQSYNNGTAASAPILSFQRGRGSVASPASTQNGDFLAQIGFRGMAQDGSILGGSWIRSIYRGDGTTKSADLAFGTYGPDNPSGGSNRMLITEMGNVGIGPFNNTTVIPEKKLDVVGDFRSKKTNNGIMHLLETNSTLIPDATTFIVANNEDISQMTQYSATIAQSSSVYTSVNDNNVGSTYSIMSPSNGIYGTDDANNGTGSSLNVLGIGTGILSSYNNVSGYDSSISVSPQSAGLIVQKSLTGQAAIFGVNTQSLYFQFKESAGVIKGAYEFPSNYGTRGQVLTTHGAPSDPGNGGQANLLTWRDVADLIVLKAPNGSCYKLTVDNSGNLGTTPDADCTVDAYSPLTYSKIAGSANADEYSEDNIFKMLQDQNKMIEEQNKVIENMKAEMKILNKN